MFDAERMIFAQFKEGLQKQPTVLDEFAQACHIVNARYNTAIYENRFVVGGVVEQLLGASMRAVGVEIVNVAKARKGVDLYHPGTDSGFSVKSQFQRGSEIRLVNTMGNAGNVVSWIHATLFVIAGVGIGYGDPASVSNGLLLRSDALLLSLASLEDVWRREPRSLIEHDIPRKPRVFAGSRVASDVVAQDIMIEFKNLSLHYQPER